MELTHPLAFPCVDHTPFGRVPTRQVSKSPRQPFVSWIKTVNTLFDYM